MAKNKYANDYEIVTGSNPEGQEIETLVYRGEYFEPALDKNELRIFRRNCFLLLTIIIIFHVGAGVFRTMGMYQFYVALPYVLAFYPMYLLAAGVLRLPKMPGKFRRDEIGLSFGRIKTSSVALLILVSLGLIGESLFILFISESGQRGLELIYVGPEILVFLAGYLLYRLEKRIQITNVTEEV